MTQSAEGSRLLNDDTGSASRRRSRKMCGLTSLVLLLLDCTPAPCTCIIKFPPLPTAQPCTATTSDAVRDRVGSSGLGQTANIGSASKMIWDGDAAGLTAKGWADCEKKPQCKSSLAPQAGVGLKASVGLKFRAEGEGWIGGGWNLFGWWPTDAGIDTSEFKSLRLAIRIESKDKTLAPDLGALIVNLKCSNKKDGCQSQNMKVADYVEGNLLDGNWHVVKLPLAELNKKEGFDPRKVWEIDLNTWSRMTKDFSVYIDDIAFESE